MSAGEAVIRKRLAAATEQDRFYVEYLRREDVTDLIADLDDARLRAGLVAVPADAHVIQVAPDGPPSAAMLLPPMSEEVVADAGRQYGEALDRMLGVDPSWANEPVRGYSEPTVWRPCVPPTPLPEGFGALFVTFGVQYVREPHPRFPWAHPDGYLQVQYRRNERYSGDSWALARAALLQWSHGAFATTYDELDDELLQYLPWGQLALMVLP